MARQILIGFVTEGPTDVRFLESIIQITFDEVALECKSQVDILSIQYISKDEIEIGSGNFVETTVAYARKADEKGMMILCVHVDADDATDEAVFKHKIDPAFAAVADAPAEESLCRNLVAIVPVQMTEAWMLADTELLRKTLMTTKSDIQLGIKHSPEKYADPKQTIKDAITIARQKVTKRRRGDLTIAELYLPVGQEIELAKLEKLPSYQKFKEAVREVFKKLNYL